MERVRIIQTIEYLSVDSSMVYVMLGCHILVLMLALRNIYGQLYVGLRFYMAWNVSMFRKLLAQLETVQGNHIKQFLGLSRTARTSYMLDSLHLPTVQHVL